MKKRILSLALVLCMVLTLMPVSAFADDIVASGECGDNLTWQLNSEGTLAIAGSGKMYNFEFGGCPWYSFRLDIKSIVIEEGITSIGDCAFPLCTNLTNVVIPVSVGSLGCCAFHYCTSLKSVTIPESVTSIEQSTFYRCSSLTNIIIPNRVTSIGYNAFAYCIGLTSVTIPNNVISIDGDAFSYCSNLTSITIPDSVEDIGDHPFCECNKLQSINVAIDNKQYCSENGILFNKAKTELIKYPSSKTDTNYIIPTSVTSTGDYAFSNCSNLKSVVISYGVTHIGYACFSGCSHISNVTIPNTVKSIGYYAFSGCNELATIIFHGSKEEWNLIVMRGVDESVKNATIYYKEHDYAEKVTAPTCTDKGYTTYTCDCGDSYVADYVDALGHDYVNGVCCRCGELYNPFVDVSESAVYYDAILWAYYHTPKQITAGTDSTHFSPAANCTRGQVVTFLWRAAGCPEPTIDCPFVDVSSTSPYYKAILWAAEQGITNGIDATHFAPNATVTRAQFVTFLWRYEDKPEAEGSINNFKDAGSIAKPYQEAVAWAVGEEIAGGYADGTFRPNATCTRWAVVLFMYRDLK